jgi:peptidyl-tRNA hydrolase
MTAGAPVSEWVLPLVVRLERDAPPSRTDALEAAAVAVLSMLTTDEPDWLEGVRAWDGSRIRKVVRRARGAQWRRAAALPGLTVSRRTAEVRVFPPVPVDSWPPELARLQVGGTELSDPEPPPVADEHVPLILVSPELEMSAGKAMAQVGHAAQLGWRSLRRGRRRAWQESGFDLAVRTPAVRQWRAALEGGAPVVHDAGFTEGAPGSATAAFIA